MKLLRIDYDDDEEIKDISVNMTFNEAVALVNVAGKLNGIAEQKLGLNNDESLFDCLSSVFNKEFEDGAPDKHITSLDDLNKRIEK